jgi:putative iron-dependent peroxidase
MATSGDILLHIRADQMDLCFELATQLLSALGDAISVVDEVQGFRYFDMRSMVGFVDGTENPVGRHAVDFTIIGDEDPAFSGGSNLPDASVLAPWAWSCAKPNRARPSPKNVLLKPENCLQ